MVKEKARAKANALHDLNQQQQSKQKKTSKPMDLIFSVTQLMVSR
jgi:hypothetical protein